MKILILSDSHGNSSAMQDLFLCGDYNAVIFLGDVVRDADKLAQITGVIPVYRVKGNCDMLDVVSRDELLFELAGRRVFMTHGHRYGVKSSYGVIENVARRYGADICLFGHTHVPYYQSCDGLIMINPGAFINGKYGVLEITDKIIYKQKDVYDKTGDNK